VTPMKMDLEGAGELVLNGTGYALTRVQAVIFEDWGYAKLSTTFRAKCFSVDRLDDSNRLALNMEFT